MVNTIYKIVPEPLWSEAVTRGGFGGSPVDIADGFIHFSTASQVRDTAAKHFAGVRDLLNRGAQDHGFMSFALKGAARNGADLSRPAGDHDLHGVVLLQTIVRGSAPDASANNGATADTIGILKRKPIAAQPACRCIANATAIGGYDEQTNRD